MVFKALGHGVLGSIQGIGRKSVCKLWARNRAQAVLGHRRIGIVQAWESRPWHFSAWDLGTKKPALMAGFLSLNL